MSELDQLGQFREGVDVDDRIGAPERSAAPFSGAASPSQYEVSSGVSAATDPAPSHDPVSTSKRDAKKDRPKQPPLRILREYVTLALVAVVLASLVRAFVGQAYWIPSVSMVPTLKVHDRVIVSRISYKVGDPKRGDIIVFQNPHYEDNGRKDPVSRTFRNVLELVGVGQPKDKYYIKRCIGLPGDRLQVKNDHVYINGVELKEKWLEKDVKTEDTGAFAGSELTLGKNEYFMMGDNRDQSSDSRVFGPIERSKMIGKAFVRVYPFNRAGGL